MGLELQPRSLDTLSAHDILGQLSNVRRTLNAQGRVETMSNTLTRYVMPHLIWKFNKKNGAKTWCLKK